MRPSRPSMARLMAAPVTASVLVDIASSFGSSRPRSRAGRWTDPRRAIGLLRPAGGLRPFGGQIENRVGILLEAAKIDLHAVEQRAPMAHDRRHSDSFPD